LQFQVFDTSYNVDIRRVVSINDFKPLKLYDLNDVKIKSLSAIITIFVYILYTLQIVLRGAIKGATGAIFVAILKSYNAYEAIRIGIIAGVVSMIVEMHMDLACYIPSVFVAVAGVSANNRMLMNVANVIATFTELIEPIPINVAGASLACYVSGDDVAKGAACGSLYGCFVTFGRLMDKTFSGEDLFDIKRLGKWEKAMKIVGASMATAGISKGFVLGFLNSGILCGISFGENEDGDHFLKDILETFAEIVRRDAPALLTEDIHGEICWRELIEGIEDINGGQCFLR
jgi:hypothetical protein